MELIIKIMLTLSAALAFGYGTHKYLGKKAALFKLLVTFSFGCFMLGRLNELITYMVSGSTIKLFNIGMLSIIGGFMFIFSASYGQMDGLVDDRGTALTKYRLISLFAPLCIFPIYIPIYNSFTTTASKIVSAIIILMIALASYFSLKHVVIPDVSFGIIKSIRHYNLVCLILELAYAVQLMADKTSNMTLWVVSSAVIIIISPLVIFVMERGSRKWVL